MALIARSSRLFFRPQFCMHIINNFRSTRSGTKNFKRQGPIKENNPGIQNFLDDYKPSNLELEEIIDSGGHFMDEYAAFEDNITDLRGVDREIKEEDARRRKVGRHKMVERLGGFRPPQETNLLTYEAKCQIRYLNSLNPQEWSPYAISMAFAVSENSATKVIRNNYLLRNMDQVKKHNAKVANNWELLKMNSEEISPETRRLYQEQQWPQQLSLPREDLPMPNPLPLLKDYSKMDYSLPNKVGPFLSIVKTHLKQKQIEQKNRKLLEASETILPDKDETAMATIPETSTEVSRARKVDNVPSRPARREDIVRPPIITSMEDIESATYIPAHAEGRGKMMKLTQFKKARGLKSEPKALALPQSDSPQPEDLIALPEKLQKPKLKPQKPEKIDIPREKYRKNAVYQVRNTFYDSEGNVIFKVPI